MDAYAAALARTVRPGSVVLDIGTGTGLMALLACRLGARRVFAVDPGDSIHLARAAARASGFADRIRFFASAEREQDVDLPLLVLDHPVKAVEVVQPGDIATNTCNVAADRRDHRHQRREGRLHLGDAVSALRGDEEHLRKLNFRGQFLREPGGQIRLWVEVGAPDADRLHRAAKAAGEHLLLCKARPAGARDAAGRDLGIDHAAVRHRHGALGAAQPARELRERDLRRRDTASAP